MSSAHPTTDHDEIRQWAEKQGGRPARVRGTGGKNDPGMIRIEFRDPDDHLEEISWEDWFKDFEDNKLALLHTEDTRFAKLISRDNAEKK